MCVVELFGALGTLAPTLATIKLSRGWGPQNPRSYPNVVSRKFVTEFFVRKVRDSEAL
jgi:hypothetical protein